MTSEFITLARVLKTQGRHGEVAVAVHSDVPDWDAPVPTQQMSVMAPSTPVPITRFRTECGRCKSSSFGCCRYNRFPPLFMAVSYWLEACGSLTCEN